MSTVAQSVQYITFKLGDELFAINVGQVREVLDISLITKVPAAPAYLRGVVNVRGCALPVVDLRTKFGLAAKVDTVNTRILVLDLKLDGETSLLGGMADSVHEVIELDPTQINPPPRIAMRWRSEFIQGVGRRGDQFIILLDIAAVFTADELSVVQSSASVAPATAATES